MENVSNDEILTSVFIGDNSGTNDDATIPQPVSDQFPFLRVKSTGEIIPYNPSFANHGELVEGVYDLYGSTTPPSDEKLAEIRQERAEIVNSYVIPTQHPTPVQDITLDKAVIDEIVERVVAEIKSSHAVIIDRLGDISTAFGSLVNTNNKDGGDDGTVGEDGGNILGDQHNTSNGDAVVSTSKLTNTTDDASKQTSKQTSKQKKTTIDAKDYV